MSSTVFKTDPSCMDDFDPKSLLAEDASERIQRTVQPVSGFEKVPIRSALGRVLYRDVHSRLDVPGHTNSAMDGYAVRGIDLPTRDPAVFDILGTAWAGRPFAGHVGENQAVRIMTGAPLPDGTDTVVIQEHAQVSDTSVHIDGRHKPGQNVRKAGEDIAKGQVVLHGGRRLTPADIGLLASLGVGEVRVHRTVRVAFFSTGDELRSIGEILDHGAIYDSNRYTIHGMLTRIGAHPIDMGVIRDERKDTEEAFIEAAGCADVVITSGGVSVGQADFVKEVLQQIGQITFWKVAMKPGRPLAFGRIRDAWFFGLPGNPVSVMVTFYLFVQPALKRLMGETETAPRLLQARCESRLKKKAGRTEYQRGILGSDDNGKILTVTKTGAQGSGILNSMSQADCFVILPLEAETVEPGTTVTVLPFSEIM